MRKLLLRLLLLLNEWELSLLLLWYLKIELIKETKILSLVLSLLTDIQIVKKTISNILDIIVLNRLWNMILCFA
jgi:hypothetical protein